MISRLLTLLAAAFVIAGTIAAPAVSASQSVEVLLARPLSQSEQASVGIAPPPCQDGAYRLIGAKWAKTYTWSFKAGSTPGGLVPAAVAVVLQKSFNNVTGGNNDCGMPDNISATHQYLGQTTKSPNCNSRDGSNVVGFGRLALGVLAVTCFWMSGSKMLEADMKINNREKWALSMVGCSGDSAVLEATVTHEAGHVFGLDHVGERRHGRLTMSPFLDGPCENNESTLGKGDMLGLEKLY